jgi:hypothetical protein
MDVFNLSCRIARVGSLFTRLDVTLLTSKLSQSWILLLPNLLGILDEAYLSYSHINSKRVLSLKLHFIRPEGPYGRTA